jgi:hypothetical protein
MMQHPNATSLFLILSVLILSCISSPAQEEEETKNWSPDGSFYAIDLPGAAVGKGRAQERFEIHAADGKLVSTIYVWTTEPDGSEQIPGIRGCEGSGWIDSTRFYCEGSSNPSMGIYRYFDAQSGREIGERVGSEFTWSPDNSRIANFGNVPHFSPSEYKSDSLEVGKYRYPSGGWNDKESHLFRSGISWSPDSLKAAVVDHRGSDNRFYLVVVSAKTGKQFLKCLNYEESEGHDDWPAPHDFSLQWDETKLTISPPRGDHEVVEVR